MIKINVIVKDKTWLRFIKNPEIYLKRKIRKIQKEKLFKKNNFNFSLQLSGTKEIKFLNKKFRKKNKSTDVLSFPYNTKKKFRELKNTKLEIYLGDIIINFRKINASSKILFKKKFDELWIHGLVHLFGYDHIKDSNFKKMNYIEKKFLKKIN